MTFDAANALIHSRTDCCNAILIGVSDGVIRKLQTVLHAAACLVTAVHWNERHADYFLNEFLVLLTV